MGSVSPGGAMIPAPARDHLVQRQQDALRASWAATMEVHVGPSWLERDVAMTPDFNAEAITFAAM
jgi:hypothetical protein